MPRAICSINDLKYLSEDKYDEKLYKMIEGFYDVFLYDSSDEEIQEQINENPIIKSLCKRENAAIYYDDNVSNLIKNDEYINFLNDILILDKEKNLSTIRECYGILATHVDDSFIEENSFNFEYEFENIRTDIFKSWRDLFNKKKMKPLNSAILIDNHLWPVNSRFNEDNESNLYQIITSLIPEKLIQKFHLIIVVQNPQGRYTKDWVKEKIGKIQKRIKRETGKDIDVGIITQTDTKTFHKRILITNNHYVFSDNGFTIFRNNRVDQITDGKREFLFKDIDNYEGTSLKSKHTNWIGRVKKVINDNKKTSSDIVFNLGNFESPLLS